ncbi:unnamed protein product [Fraxinus pennsylvanica]|uniref:Secreted protein n=1 Tax=Fraxinus pennsylvanica TaxID=56036 RepID=A0AAD1YKE7_9LAMI|nr:unnamed protein product [Fraxinus pennsylvanica]
MGSRSVLGAVLLVSFLWFMFTGISAHLNNRRTVITISSSRSFRSLKHIESQKRINCQNFDLNCASKRRVPNFQFTTSIFAVEFGLKLRQHPASFWQSGFSHLVN